MKFKLTKKLSFSERTINQPEWKILRLQILYLQMQSLDNIILFPVDKLLKTEMKGSKGDLKRPCERAWKDYQDKFTEVEKQKKRQAKEAGLHKSELTAGEIAEEMEKERKYLQLTTSEYLLKINEIRTKKGVDFIEQLLDYYKAQHK